MSDPQRAKSTLFITPLAPSITTHSLHDIFIPFGPITDISLPAPELKSSTDPHRGFGYVEFESVEDAQAAMDNMDQAEIFGRVVKVSVAKERKAAGEGLGAKTAVWEQEGYLAQHAVSEEDRMKTGDGDGEEQAGGVTDPMQGLEQLDVAGPRLS